MARRSLAKCPKALSKYGFCGLLAVIYAAKLDMPANLSQLQAFFGEVKRICAMRADKWRNALPKKQGGISFEHTLSLLQHYKGCGFEEVHTPLDTCKPNLSMWLRRSVLANSCYIVHVGKHAFFVDVGRSKGRWRIYDQRGARSKKDLKSMCQKGQYGRKLVTRVLKITEFV